MLLISFGEVYELMRGAAWWARRLFYYLIKFLLVCWVGIATNWVVETLILLVKMGGFYRHRPTILPGVYPASALGWLDFALLVAARGGVGLVLAALAYTTLRMLDGEYLMGLTRACNGELIPGSRREWRRELFLLCLVVVLVRSWWDLIMYAFAV